MKNLFILLIFVVFSCSKTAVQEEQSVSCARIPLGLTEVNKNPIYPNVWTNDFGGMSDWYNQVSGDTLKICYSSSDGDSGESVIYKFKMENGCLLPLKRVSSSFIMCYIPAPAPVVQVVPISSILIQEYVPGQLLAAEAITSMVNSAGITQYSTQKIWVDLSN